MSTTATTTAQQQYEQLQHLKRMEENTSLYKTILKFVCGGVSAGFVSGLMNSPDHVKTRMQLTHQSTTNSGNTTNMSFSRAYYNLYKTEGLGVLLGRGLFAAVVREQFYSSVRMGLYDPLKFILSQLLSKNSNVNGHVTTTSDVGLTIKILSGAISGSIGSIVSNGCDLVKIRQQSVMNGSRAPNWFFIVKKILKEENGVMGLFRGGTPNVLRASILTATQLSTYDHTKHLLLKTPYFSDNVYTHVTASLVAGLLSTLATNPSDVIKTKLMASKKSHHGVSSVAAEMESYRGLIDCAVKTYQKHGMRAFMSGFVPNYIRIGTHCLLTLPLYEELRKLMGLSSV
ncbi:hypothetical protein C9374_001970 [Naegleria lovaniensis]|uniref:Uncharacterized protein n=1 Tax=Naegleria lovaniensis TaxID=51637 RepID=A0AA88KKL5_NAELO|nr:uncharacterized protein C9374_001970 [Naegleria lovaniensis]KAG2386935.1 hypothetical protein C9374_001970 [Naegleria lovaniensis]